MTRNIPVRGATIAVDDVGEGEPVLLLHGFPATRRLWSHVVPLLAGTGTRLLLPDLVGYGDSEAPEGARIDMASQARWMFELLDRLDVERATLVAHDVGSAAAQIMLATSPRRVRGLVVLDGVFEGEWAMGAVESIQKWDPAEASRLFPVLVRRLAKTAPLREVLGAYEGERGGLRLIRAARDLEPRQTESIAEALRASTVPALVLWGEHDTFLPLATVGRPLAALLQAPLVVLPGGHFTPSDCPAEVSAELRAFFSRLPLEIAWGD